MPRRCLNVSEHEIMRGFKVTTGAIEPLSFVVPRKVRGHSLAIVLISTVRLIPGRHSPAVRRRPDATI